MSNPGWHSNRSSQRIAMLFPLSMLDALDALVAVTGKTRSVLIREAVDMLILKAVREREKKV